MFGLRYKFVTDIHFIFTNFEYIFGVELFDQKMYELLWSKFEIQKLKY